MLIPGMEGMGGSMGRGGSSESTGGEAPPPRKPKCKGLKGLAERAAGLCE
jgi:hypothetical protein